MVTIVQKKWKGKKGKLQTGYQAQVRMKGQFLSSTFDTRKKAKIWIEEQEMLIRKGYSVSEGKKITVSDAIDRYISEISINKKAHKNEVGIWNRLKVNNSNFVNLRIAEVNPTHILHLRNKSAKRGKTVANYELKLLNHLFNNAIKLWRVVELNPVSPIERYKTQKGRYAPLYYAEYRQILKTAFSTDVSSLVSMARFENGHAIDPIAVYRTLDYKKEKSNTRKNSGGSSSGIVKSLKINY